MGQTGCLVPGCACNRGYRYFCPAETTLKLCAHIRESTEGSQQRQSPGASATSRFPNSFIPLHPCFFLGKSTPRAIREGKKRKVL